MTIKAPLRSAVAVSLLALPMILGGCATEDAEARAAAARAQSTADQALSTAQAASQKADAAAAQAAEANSKVDQLFQKSLAK